MPKASPLRKSRAAIVYDGPMLNFSDMEEQVRAKIVTIVDDLKKMAREQEKDEELVDSEFADWNVKVTKRSVGPSNANSLLEFVYSCINDATVKARSKIELAKKIGLIETAPLIVPRAAKPLAPTERLANAYLTEDFTLLEPLRVSRFTVVTNIGNLEPSSIHNGKIYPIGYTARTLFPSPVTPTKDVVYECRIEPGPRFIVEHVGAPTPADIYIPSAPVEVERQRRESSSPLKATVATETDRKELETEKKKGPSPSAKGGKGGKPAKKKLNEDEEDEEEFDSADDDENEKPAGRQRQQIERNRIFPESVSDKQLKFSAEGSTPHEAWTNLVAALETRIIDIMNRQSYMSAAQPPGHIEEAVALVIRGLVDEVEASVSRVRKPTILTNEDLKTNLGDFLFGLNDYRINACILALPGIEEEMKPTGRSRKVQAEFTSQKQTREMEKKLMKSINNFAERFRNHEIRAERACDRRMRLEFNASKVVQEKAKKQVTKQASATRKGDQSLDQSKRTSALTTIKKLEEKVADKLKGKTKLLEEFAKTIAVVKQFWEQGRLNPNIPEACAKTEVANFFPMEQDWKQIDTRILQAWDFCSTFGTVLGICSAESRAAYVAGEFRSEDKLILKSRAPSFRPSMELDEFIESFESCNEQLLGPICTGLLRLAAATVYAYREDVRVRVETAKKNGHPYVEPGDECDKFGKVVEVIRDVRDGDIVHFLIAGVPICESTWFELARVCFTWRKFQQRQFQQDVDESLLPKVRQDLVQALNQCSQTAPSLEQDSNTDLDTSNLNDGEEDEDDAKNKRKTSKKPAWVQILSEVKELQANRARKIKDIIEQVLRIIPKREREAKQILKDALDLYQSNAGAKMRDRALDAVKLANESTNHLDTSNLSVDKDDEDNEDDDGGEKINIAVRPMTPLDSHCLKVALLNVFKKMNPDSMFEPPLRAVELKLGNGGFSCPADVLIEVESVWTNIQRVSRSQKENLMKESATLRGEFKQFLDQACKENSIADLGGAADVCVVRRLGMSRPHTLFSLYPKDEEDENAIQTKPELEWESLGGVPFATAANVVEEEAEDDWMTRVHRARTFQELNRDDRLVMMLTLIDIAVSAEEIKVDIKAREAEVEKARSKYGNANHLYSIAGTVPIPLCETEQTIDSFIVEYQGTFEPCGVPLEAIEHVKRDIHEENISRKRLQKTAPLRSELDRTLYAYEIRPKFLGFDRLNRSYYHFPSLHQSLLVFVEPSDSFHSSEHYSFQITSKFEEVVQCLEQGNDPREIHMAGNIREILPILTNEPRITVWCRLAESSNNEEGGEAPVEEKKPGKKGSAAAVKAAAAAAAAAAAKEEKERKEKEEREKAALANESIDPVNNNVSTNSTGAVVVAKKAEVWTDLGPNVGMRVGRRFPFTDEPNSKLYTVGGFIASYLPPGGEEDPALWKMVHDDGDVEDLEKSELEEGLTLAQSPIRTQCRFYFPIFPDTIAVRKTSMKYAKLVASYCFSVATYASKCLLDLKVILLCIEKALCWDWKERDKWQQLIFQSHSWKGVRLALAWLEWKCLEDQKLPAFAEYFRVGAASGIDSLSLLACRILALDRSLRYPTAQTVAQALREKREREMEEERKIQEEKKKALAEEKKRKQKEERDRRAEETRQLKQQRLEEIQVKKAKAQSLAAASPGTNSNSKRARRSLSEISDSSKSTKKSAAKVVAATPASRKRSSSTQKQEEEEEEESVVVKGGKKSSNNNSNHKKAKVVPSKSSSKKEVKSASSKNSSKSPSSSSSKHKIVVEDDDDDDDDDEEEEEEEEAPSTRRSKRAAFQNSQFAKVTKKQPIEEEDDEEDEEDDEDEEEDDEEEEEDENESGDEEEEVSEEDDEEEESPAPPTTKRASSASNRSTRAAARSSNASSNSNHHQRKKDSSEQISSSDKRAIRAARRS